MKFISLARKIPAELPAPSLADEATSMVGFHDALIGNAVNELREYDQRLEALIETSIRAQEQVREALARAEAMAPKRASELAAE